MRRLACICVAMWGCSGAGHTHGDLAVGGAADMSAPAATAQSNPPLVGAVIVTSFDLPGRPEIVLDGVFSRYDGNLSGPCSVAQVGGCSLVTCPLTDSGAPVAGPQRTHVGAGDLTLSGVGAPFVVPADPYSYNATDRVAWQGGELLTLQSSGDTVPSFMVQTPAAGKARMLTPPAPQDGSTVTVTRAAGWTVTWQATAPGRIELALAGPGQTLTCDLAPETGSFTVPSAALTRLRPGEWSAGAVAATQATTMAGAWPVTFTAQRNLDDDASGNLWAPTVTLK